MAKAPQNTKFHFDEHLILNRWLFSLFHKTSLNEFKSLLESVENDDHIASDGQSHFYHRLSNELFFEHDNPLSLAELAAYDLRLVHYWQKITEKRNRTSGHILRPKYFQYLSLLFTEIYLDWYFNKKAELQTALNQQLVQYAKEMGKNAQDFEVYRLNDLNKIAFWNATGSGKTLLMHVNILQYLHYFGKNQPLVRPDKVIVLTPNEGLSGQHKEELELSGFQASFFDKNVISQTAFNFSVDEVGIGKCVEIIDVNKLADKSGDKTVSVEAFEGNNLVLVDEGHRGISGEQWLLRREALVKGGFAFEYSATLGQAVAGRKTIAKQVEDKQKAKAKLLFNKGSLKGLSEDDLAKLTLDELEMAKVRTTAVLETYAKSVLFDYSYKHFYHDGYGKESLILNIEKQGFDEHLPVYFVAGLLSFYQQLYLFEQHKTALAEWNIEKPLMVFVGNKVADDNSDILTVVRQLAFFVNEPQTVQKWLKELILDNPQILGESNKHVFKGRFVPLLSFVDDVATLYQDMLRKIFGATHSSRLRLTHLKKSDGELALSLGEQGEKFGVINIGDASGLLKTAQENFADEFDAVSDEFNGGLFAEINHKTSPVNILIGSRKFTEGWSSWRVSTMGLLNMGKGEGSQIIQLFGRGVRLKGREWSLKRSLPSVRPKGVFLEKLETLNIFGINADYMEVFRGYLDDEDIQTGDEMLTLDFPVQKRLPAIKLKTLKLKEEVKGNRKQSFKRVKKNIYLFEIPEEWQNKIKGIEISLDRYPKVQSFATKGTAIAQVQGEQRDEVKLNSALFDFFDWDKIYLQVARFKHQQSWYNLRLDKAKLRQFAEQSHWYRLYMPKAALKMDSFAQVALQQEILTDLLLEYVKAFYNRLKAAYEGQFYEVVTVDDSNGSMLDKYQFSLPDNDEGNEIKQRLEALADGISEFSNGVKPVYGGDKGLQMLCFDGHLYAPIFACLERQDLPFSIQPLAIGDESELRLISDLVNAKASGKLSEWTQGKDLYLLRNAANKSKGLGFALAGNFYPDFLLWLVDNQTGKQWLSLIDPKGIRNMDLDNAKFGLYDELQKLARELKIETPILSAFILSITKQADLLNVGHLTTQDFAEKHILFMDGNQVYLKQMFKMMLQ
ncbi:type III restriction endonuclease subunit R [Glaesserella parasuis]|uniref:DEAD/DEAH box helicase family protein n=1 Tax=Glaesserella parasuis TaxID=738 RepID=UPI0004ED8BE9|nr:DEAD/DEAH box helicase family protein [Glaesserella parasuis]AIK90728.1 type III restriction protein, res subunit [Glaesserella parasuis]MDG6259560.1 DEAD/DEAH box helicase family protein [Glaesserella parasuis]MDG6270068.1 DEAD/DEAH box helicase family protein [Glaesserella parasuis]MDO9853751.1 DEAD/DEAH box helicase family protein [Glaesserella parasuis]MDO9946786.1 DEAD/DEAH box helicase family protein [Glaesserella parasuis]